MEPAFPLNNLKTQLCVMAVGYGSEMERRDVWPAGAEMFLRRIHKAGIHVTVIGPRPPFKIGSKKTVRFMDRHEVVGMKMLAASKAFPIEFRVLNRKMKGWTRLRSEACVVFGPWGVLPIGFEGWNTPGVLTIHALARWMLEHKQLPGQQFAFVGSTNQVLRWATAALDMGARDCYVIETGAEPRCWRTYRERFIAKGGKFLAKHAIRRLEARSANQLRLYLDNDKGTMLLDIDTVILAPINDEMLNSPQHWKSGLFYVQRRSIPAEPGADEEKWLELNDWSEVLWRVSKFLGLVEHPEAEGALKKIRSERRALLGYRKPEGRMSVGYSGKILDRDTLARVQSSLAVPRSFAREKPVASLECFETIACRACADACPAGAIEIANLLDQPRLFEEKCTGCGVCVAACPSGAAVMVREMPTYQKAHYYFADDSKELWRPGTLLQLINRRGEALGSARTVASVSYQGGLHRVLSIESSNVYLWEARGFKLVRPEAEPIPMTPGDVQEKRGWITLNGARRLSPVDVPISVALWQLGQRRFEDALYCHDGGCRLCEVTVDGKPALGCRTIVKEGQNIEFGKTAPRPREGRTLCACKQVQAREREELLAEGAPESLVRELTGIGSGTCHGRWCLSSEEYSPRDKLRPNFHGFEISPWRDIVASDVIDAQSVPGGDDESEAAGSDLSDDDDSD